MIISSNTFKEKNKNELTLFIFIFPGEVQAVVQDVSNKKVEAFDKVSDIKDLGILDYAFADVQVFIANNHFTLIPDALFDIEKISSLLDFSVNNIDQLETRHDAIPKFDLQVIWGIDKETKAQIIKFWPGASIQHLISKKLYSVNENQCKNSLFIDVVSKGSTAILFVENKLQLANFYPSESATNTLYYSLVGLERTNSSPEEIQAFINADQKSRETIGRYFSNIAENTSDTCSLPITEQDKSILALL